MLSNSTDSIFFWQLEKIRDAVTVANLRAAYAEAQTANLTESSSSTATYTAKTDSASATVKVTGVVAKGTQDGFSNLDGELPFTAPDEMGGTAKTYEVTFTYDNDGSISKVEAK